MTNNNMSIQLSEVAQRIRTLREILEISEQEMAKNTDVTVAEYKEYESGDKDFSFTFIYKCAKHLDVDPTDLIRGISPTLSSYNLTRKGDGLPITRRQGFKYINMAPLFKHKVAEPFYVKMPYSEEEQNQPIKLSTHVGQELDIVISGKMKMQIGEHTEILCAGDSVYYDSSTPHGMVAVDENDAEIYAVVIKPDLSENIQEEIKEDTFENIVKTKLERKNNKLVVDPFIDVTETKEGVLQTIKFKNDDKFNFSFDIVDKLAEKCPNKTAMVYVSDDFKKKTFSFADMKKYSNMTANYFASLGIKKGDRVMLVLKRHYQFWFSILALHKLGAIVVPATNLLVCHDFEYRFNAAGVKAIVCTADGDVANQVDLAQAKSPTLETKILVNGSKNDWHNFDEEISKFSSQYDRSEDTACGDEPMLMFFTSGTTGYPKIALHNYKYTLGHYITAKYWHNVNSDGVHFTVADTGWGKALWGKLYGQWMCEAATFVYDFDKFDATNLLEMFKEYGITTFCAPPTIYRFFVKEDLSKYDLSSLEYATTAGEALNPEVFEQWKKATGLALMEGFGQTETTLTIYNPVGTTPKVGSMGKPSPLYDVDIILPDGKSAPVGEVGEIVVRTSNEIPCGLFMGYYNNEEKTKEVWHDGYYHTGDTAWRDEDGYFWYVGRTDDVIKSSGYRIGPFEIESVIMELPYILECAATAAPDPVRGQVVKATIVLTKGTIGTDELKKEIQNYVKQNTAPYKYPRIVEFVDELPKTISGKIRRVDLRD